MTSLVSPPNTYKRWFDVLAVLLLFASLLVAASQLVATNWVDYLYLSWVLVFFGGILGTALGYSRFSPLVSIVLTVLYGLFFIPWQLGLTFEAEIPWQERLSGMVDILNQTFIQLRYSERVTSPLLFLTIVALLAWVLSVFTAYSLTRFGSAWRTIIPGGVVMILISTYGVNEGTNTFLFGLFILLALLLIARVLYVKRRERWQNKRAILPADIGPLMGRVILVGCVILVFLAWGAPSVGARLPSLERAWQSLTRPLSNFRQSMGNAFAPIDSQIGLVGLEVVGDYYGDSLQMGQGNILSDDPLFLVKAADPPSAMPRYYWRAKYYETYNNGQWKTGPALTSYLTPDEFTLNSPEYKERWETTVSILPRVRMSTLYTPNEPVWVNRPVEANIVTNSGGIEELISVRATSPLFVAEEYSVRSSLENATINDLRSAGTDYPEWVIKRYLQVPDSVTPRTIELALQIANGYDNPYDVAMAVTRYLRSNIKYQEYFIDLPNDQDLIDWLLFDKREGFCNYYASAEVIMLRSLGIPARLAVGFAQGETIQNTDLLTNFNDELLDKSNGSLNSEVDFQIYHVRQRDAHAWPEVYFPGTGWVVFEPTANQEPLIRPLGIVQNSTNSGSPQSNENIPELDGNEPILDTDLEQTISETELGSINRVSTFSWNPVIFLGVFILGMLIWKNVQFHDLTPLPIVLESVFFRLGLNPPTFLQKWVILVSLPPVEGAFNELNQALNRLGINPSPSATPLERATSLMKLIPESQSATEVLIDEYQKTIYSQRPGDQKNASRAGRVIRRLSFGTWLERVASRIKNRGPNPTTQSK